MINKLENVNTINESKNTTYLSFYAEIYSCYYCSLSIHLNLIRHCPTWFFLHTCMWVSLKTQPASFHRIIITTLNFAIWRHTHIISRDAHPMSSNSFAETKHFLALAQTSASQGRYEKQYCF